MTTAATVDRESAAAIRRSLAAVPFPDTRRVYAGDADVLRPGSYADPMPVSAIIAMLDNLADAMRDANDDHDVLVEEHRRITDDVAAMRRVLGTR